MKNTKVKVKMDNLEVVNLKVQLMRAMADYDNLKKRVEREREEIIKLSSLGLLVRLLPIVDMFEGALKHLNDSGLAIAISEFVKVLKEDGIAKIGVEIGDKFDENIHEVVEAVEIPNGGTLTAGTVSEVVLPGWKYTDGTIIRHAKVKVIKDIK
jgi:molecular chaperone GrpE